MISEIGRAALICSFPALACLAVSWVLTKWAFGHDRKSSNPLVRAYASQVAAVKMVAGVMTAIGSFIVMMPLVLLDGPGWLSFFLVYGVAYLAVRWERRRFREIMK
jgi:hypothetical protein